MGFGECYQLGNVVKTHGLKGQVVIFLDVDDPSEYKKLESVFIDINGKLIPFFIESLNLQGDRAIVTLDEIASIEDATPLIGKDLYLPLRNLPDLPEGKYYYHQLPGLDVVEGGTYIGLVKEVFQMPNNNLLAVDHKGVEVLIPLSDGVVKKVNLSENKIEVVLPEGLLDVYLNDKP
ncbi:MAG: 16S rRNA processing protein RimM [Cyclobacteriaceae bacterium]